MDGGKGEFMKSLWYFLLEIIGGFADLIRVLAKIFVPKVSFQPIFAIGGMTPQISRPRSVFEKKPSNATGGTC